MGKLVFLKNKQFLVIALFAVLVMTGYTNCSGYQDNNLFDAESNGGLGNVQTYENRLFSPTQGIAVEATENMMTIAGECNVTNGTNHYIEVRLIAANGANTPYRIREDGTCASNPNDPECFRVNMVCNYGRYYATLPVGGWVNSSMTGCSYFIRGQLVIVENGVEKRENKNLFNLNTVIYDNTNPSCPW